MKIEDAIHLLEQRKDYGVKSIILAYWESDSFDEPDNEEWATIAEEVEDKMDWSMTHDQMSQIINLTNN